MASIGESKKTPKEWFLSKVYLALQEFEETTGVEVLKIEIDRLNLDEVGKTAVESPSKFIEKWRLTLR